MIIDELLVLVDEELSLACDSPYDEWCRSLLRIKDFLLEERDGDVL